MSLEDIEKLKRNNHELQEIINNSWDGIGIIDKQTKFIYINNAFMPILGFFKEELLNKKFTQLMEKKFIKEFENSLIIKDKNKKHQAEVDIVCIRKDKKKVYLKITISSMLNKNLFVINTKDITSQISDNEILNDYIISMHTDLHGHITKASSAFLKLSGYTSEEIIGKAFSTLAHDDTDSIVYKNINKSLENFQEWNGKLKKKKKDGSAFWLNTKIKPIFNKYGDVTGYTSYMFDITNEINLNDEASLLQEQVSIAQNEIDQKNTLLVQQSKLAIMSETLQKLSHEWRQPLNLISVKAQKLELEYELNRPSIKKTINILEEIKNEANNLSLTIEKFQKFLEPKNNKELTKPSIIIEEAINIFKKENELNNIKIEYEIKDDIIYNTYKEETKTVLLNLFINSKEAFEKNNIKEGLIKVNEDIVNDNLYIEVSDDAGGIDNNIIHKIFEPYYSTKNKKHGVGLGLYTSKIVVNTHLDGIITVLNNKFGVTFKISIPIK